MDNRGALISLHVSVFLMGASGLFGKLVSTSAFFLVFGRVLFAAIVLAAVMRWRGDGFRPQSRKDAVVFLALGALMAFHWFSFFHAIQLSSVALGLLTFSTFTVFATVLEPFFFPQRLTWRDAGVVALCCAGVWVLLPDFKLEPQMMAGVVWGILSGLSYAFMLLLNKNYVQRYQPMTLTFYQCFVAMLVLLPVVLWRMESVLPMDWLYLVVHGAVCTALAFTLYVASAKSVSAQIISVTTMLEVFYGAVLAYFLLGEAMNAGMIAGGVLIMSASYLAMRKKA